MELARHDRCALPDGLKVDTREVPLLREALPFEAAKTRVAAADAECDSQVANAARPDGFVADPEASKSQFTDLINLPVCNRQVLHFQHRLGIRRAVAGTIAGAAQAAVVESKAVESESVAHTFLAAAAPVL